MKKVKNAAETAKTWCGQEIQPGDYYTIPQTEYTRWAEDDAVVCAIACGDAIMNDGEADLSGAAAQIEFLIHGKTETIATVKAEGGRQLQGIGHFFTATAGQDTSSDFVLPQVRMNGGVVETKNENFGDTLDAQIIDRDNLLGGGAGAVLATYADGWVLSRTAVNVLRDDTIGSLLPVAGLVLRLTYHSTGGTDVDVSTNLYVYVD